MGTAKLAICVTGWYYDAKVYETLRRIPGVDVFAVSHKPHNAIPKGISDLVDEDKLFIRPNIGYDWGCYQQFLETNIWRNYDYSFFLHDDLIIYDPGFVEAGCELLDKGYAVIGNDRAVTKTDWPRTHSQCYAHSEWQPPSRDFTYEIVRGSFFATSRRVLSKLGSFEVFWDRFRLNIGFGNWSLVASCGKLREKCGKETFAYLSDFYGMSRFVRELKRGGKGKTELPRRYGWAEAVERFSLLCKDYMSMRGDSKDTIRYAAAMHSYRCIIRLIAGR